MTTLLKNLRGVKNPSSFHLFNPTPYHILSLSLSLLVEHVLFLNNFLLHLFSRIGTSVKTEICKYFESSGGCARGSSCFYAHGEEKLRQVKQGMHLIHSSAVQKLKRKIFVGGLNPLLDSG